MATLSIAGVSSTYGSAVYGQNVYGGGGASYSAGSLAFSQLTLARLGAQYALDIVTGRSGGQGLRSTYLALLTAAPAEASSLAALAECTMTGYGRQQVVWSVPSASDPSETHNSGTLSFGPFGGTPQTLSHFALVSASSGTVGDFLAWGAIASPLIPTAGQTLQVQVGALSIQLRPA